MIRPIDRRILGFLFCYVAFGSGLHALAAETFEFYNGVRGLGMGGARIAVVNDETALLINPAGLGKLRDYIVTIADPEIAIGAKTQAVIGSSIFAAYDPQDTLDKLNDHRGKHLHQRTQIFPSIVVPNFGFGVLAKYVTDAEVDEAGTNYRLDYTNDYAAVLGYNFRFFDGRLKIGFNMRLVNRVEISQDLDPNSVGLKVSNLASEGLGVGSDGGLIITLPWTWLPTIAAVYRDIGTTRYNLQDGIFYDTAERPRPTEGSLDAALALFPIFGKRTRFTFTGEYRGLLKTSEEEEVDSMKNVHVGMELNIGDALFVRAGMNQRYWTAGMELAMANYQLQIATYGEEIGTANATREDRRYVGKFAFRF